MPIRLALSPITALLTTLAATLGGATPALAAGGPSSLTVKVDWGQGQQDSWTLRCNPAGGTHPNAAAACAFLAGLSEPFSSQPTGPACTMIYSGPETARVIGKWQGTPVSSRFSRSDGCRTAEWHRYRSLFTNPDTIPVRGRVDLGPTCPVEHPGDVCTTVGATARVTATSRGRTRSTSAGPDGFLLRLPRGIWLVTADAGMRCASVRVDARHRPAPAAIVVDCDTGIRTRPTK